MTDDDPYLIPGTQVLRNKLGLSDPVSLDYAEREFVLQRLAEGAPKGRFDLVHLRAIHRHLFQDVYDWAGKIRTVEISKGGSMFQFVRYIPTGMADVHRRVVEGKHLRNLSRRSFAAKAGEVIGDLNYVHPFREGNGRTQLVYLEQLALKAGQQLDLRRLDPAGWIEASKAAHRGEFRPMADCIEAALD